MRLACEATLNIAKRPEILEKMREAFFVTVFCGIETPDPDALKAMHKDHNMMVPILEGIRTINSYGMEVVSGIIMGLDTDKPETGDALLAFVEESQIPLLTINLLQALPKTPLWDRLEREGRLVNDDDGRDSNVEFLLPYDQVVNSWRKCMEVAYQPEKLFARYQYQCDYTYAQRIKVPVTPEQKSWANIKRGLIMLRNIFWKVGVLGDYRRVFWKFALGRLRHGDIEGLIASVDDRTSSDHVCARGLGRPAERVELFDPAARSLGPCRVASHENAGAAVPPARSLAGADAGACRARPFRRQHADRCAACLHARPRTCARCRSRRFRCAASGGRIDRPWPAGRRGFQPGAKPARLSAPSRSRTHAGCGFAARAGKAKRQRERDCDRDRRRAVAGGRQCPRGRTGSPSGAAPDGGGDPLGHVVVASGARVALGDEIGAVLGARMVVMLIGERPGLSAPDSLGAYITFAPRIGLTDEKRNCVSNIHGAGLSYDEAAVKIAWLVREGLARQATGVALKDESGTVLISARPID